MDGKPTFVEDNERKTRNDDAEVDDGDDDDGENSTENENEDDAYENNIEDVVISKEARGRIGDNKSHSIENAKEEGDDDDEEEETLEEDNELSDTKEDDELSDTNKDNLTTDATKLKKEKKLEALRVAKELKAIKKEARKQKHASEKTAIVKTNGSATHLNVNTKDDTNKQSKMSKLNKDTQVNNKQGKHKRRRGYSSDDDYEEDEDDTYYEDWNPDAEKNPEIIVMKIKDDKDGNTEQENNDSSNKMKKSSEKRTKLNDKKIKLSEKDTGNKRRKHNKSYDKDNIKHIDNVDDCDNDGNSYNDDDAGNYKNNGDGDYDDDTDDENSDADDPDVDDIDHGDHENAKENKRNKQSTGKSGKNKSSKQASKSPISKVGTTFDIENVSTFNSNHTNSNVYQSKNQNNEQSVKIMFEDDLKNNLTEEFESISQTSEGSGRGSENSDWGFKRNSKEHTRVINQNVQKTELTDLGNKTELKGAKPKKKKVGFFSSLFGGNKANAQSNSRDKTNNETTPGGRLVNSEAATKPNENYDNVFVNPKLNAQLYKKTLFNNQSDQKVDYGDWDDGNFNEDYLPKNASNNATQGYGLSNDSSPYLTQPGEYSGTYMKHQNGTTEAMNMKTPTGYEQMNDGTMKRKSDYNNPITPLGFKKVADNIIKPVHTINDSHIGGTRISNRNEIEGNSINQLDTFFDTHVRNPYDTLELNQNKTDKRTKFNELFKTNARNKKNQLAQINTHADADRPHGHTNNDITNKNMKEAGNNQPNSYPNLQATRFNAPAQPNRSDPEPTKSFMPEGNENQPYSNPNVQAMRHGSSAKNKRSDKETTLTSPKHVQVTRNNDFLINQSDGLTRHRPRSSLSGHDDAHKNNFQGQPKDGPSGESLRKNFTDHPKKLVSFRTTYPDSTSIQSNQQQDHVQKPLDNGGDEDIEYHIADNQRGSQRRTPTSFVSGNKPAWQMQVPKDESQKGFINGGRSKTPVKDITKRNERQTLTDPEPVLDTDRLGKKFPFLKTKDSAGKSNDPIRKNQSDSNLVLKGSISNPMNGKVDNHLTRNSRLSLPNTMPDEEKGEVEKFKNLNPDLRDKVFYGFGVGRWRYAAVKWLNMWKMKRRPVKTGDSNWD
ncbi:hypothetical protein DPMN_018276 [Dreissena polymorpha]|uniref:Uncharacterized protein n=1 Tax=Dreissena polymorpha TaxID=45954 RepID=A0A9D4S879_DREPO|nr:hypothetical protein DPMN_018276 [Dreissena polymorpha]